jgi:hypothetical protein
LSFDKDFLIVKNQPWQTPKNLLIVMTVAMTLAFATWMALLNCAATD